MTVQSDNEFFHKPLSRWQHEPLIFPLTLIWALIVVMHFVMSPYSGGSSLSFSAEKMVEIFVLGNEQSFGTWFAVVLLAFGGLLAGTTGRQMASRNRTLAIGWAMLGLVMLAMSAEELLGLHETSVGPLRKRFDASGFLTFTWVILGIPITVLVFAGGWPMLRRLPRPIRNQMIAAAAIFVFGSIGMELIGGKLFSLGMGNTTAYAFSTGIEEGLELLGVLIGLDAILRFRRLEGLRATL